MPNLLTAWPLRTALKTCSSIPVVIVRVISSLLTDLPFVFKGSSVALGSSKVLASNHGLSPLCGFYSLGVFPNIWTFESISYFCISWLWYFISLKILPLILSGLYLDVLRSVSIVNGRLFWWLQGNNSHPQWKCKLNFSVTIASNCEVWFCMTKSAYCVSFLGLQTYRLIHQFQQGLHYPKCVVWDFYAICLTAITTHPPQKKKKKKICIFLDYHHY